MVLWCEKATSASSSDGDSDLQGTQNLLRLKRRKHQVTINKSGFYLVTVGDCRKSKSSFQIFFGEFRVSKRLPNLVFLR